MRVFKVNSTQFNYVHGERMHFPFSIATLVAYVKTNEMINKQFKFEKSFIFRDKLEQYLENCKDSDILLCSCYTWNWEITLYFAKKVKELNPNCLIALGGPQVPNSSENFFQKYPFIDIIIHGEGEAVLENIFKCILESKDFSEVQGIETKDFRTPPQPRIKENDIVSPYLTNVIWELVDKNDSKKWAANWETQRGCPYACTFCDWGEASFNKTNRVQLERLFAEIEWFAENKLTFIECCDANFGMFQDRDFQIATKLSETSLKTGYPKAFHSAWAKFSSEKIIPIAKELQRSGLLRDVTLALQSLDEVTLKIVKRANIKFSTFSELTQKFSENGIPTYCDIIRGMPGETLESFKRGLETLMKDSKIHTMYIYSCAVYVNAPMNDPDYKERFKIKTIRAPMNIPHVVIPEKDIQEYEELVVSTFSYSEEDLKVMHMISSFVLTFQMFGILDHIAKYYNQVYDVSFIKFYEELIDYCQNSNSLLSKEYQIVLDYINNGYEGKNWNHKDPNLGNLVWHIEEASWLRLTQSKNILMDEIESFLIYLEKKQKFDTQENVLSDLIKYQIFLLTTRESNKIKSEYFEFDWKKFFKTKELLPFRSKYFYKNLLIEEDPIEWGHNVIYYGRATRQYKFLPEFLQEHEFREEKSPIIKDVALLSP